jgi:hypothetical protein
MSQCSSLADLEGRVDALTAPFLELLVSEWLWMSTRLTSRVSSSTLSSKTPTSHFRRCCDGEPDALWFCGCDWRGNCGDFLSAMLRSAPGHDSDEYAKALLASGLSAVGSAGS